MLTQKLKKYWYRVEFFKNETEFVTLVKSSTQPKEVIETAIFRH